MIDFETFADHCDLASQSELDRVMLSAFYHQSWRGVDSFTVTDVVGWFESLLLARPNTSRLKTKIAKSRCFIKGTGQNSFRLSAKKFKELAASLSTLTTPPDDPSVGDGIIPASLVIGTRGYLERLCAQVNICYNNSAFDGCAVLMRRIIEILLVHSFEHHNIESQIEDADGKVKNLNSIIGNAIQNSTLKLTKPVKNCIDKFRELGNFSAHSIQYNAREADIRGVSIEFRVTVEELLYKSGIRS